RARAPFPTRRSSDLRVGRDVVLAPGGESPLRGRHRDEVVEAIALVDVEVPGDRAEAVGRIEVAAALGVRPPAPQPLVAILEEQLDRKSTRLNSSHVK